MEQEEILGTLLKNKKLSIVTAESCTGGGVAAAITSIPGSSMYFKGGIVAYSNEIKTKILQVRCETLEKYGAVSRETVLEMATGVMKAMNADCAIATSGIAGPDGGTAEKPVGTIWIAVAHKKEFAFIKLEGDEGRKSNIQRAIKKSISLLIDMLK